jgi:thiamine monophosphate kinase
MAVPRDGGAALAARASQLGVAVTRIGCFVPDSGQGVRVLGGAGREMTLKQAGWSHF